MSITSINLSALQSTSTIKSSSQMQPPPPPPPPDGVQGGGFAEDLLSTLEELGLVTDDTSTSTTSSTSSTDSQSVSDAMNEFMSTLFDAMRSQSSDTGYGDPVSDMESLISSLDSSSSSNTDLQSAYQSLLTALGVSSDSSVTLQDFLEAMQEKMSAHGFPSASGNLLTTTV